MDTTLDDEGRIVDAVRPRAPRRRRRRRTVLGLGPRLILAAAAMIVMVFALVEFGIKIAQPYELQRSEARQIDQMNAQVASYNLSNQELQQKIDYLQRPDGIENAARAQDWVKRGEVSLEITVAPPATPANHDDSGFSGMIRHALRTFDHRS